VRQKEFPDQWHLTAHADEAATRRQFVVAMLPSRTGKEAALPTVRLLEGRNCQAVELCTAHARHVVMFRRDREGVAMEAGGMRSDATVLAVGFDSNGKRFGSLEAGSSKPCHP
jgi:hypothetical protein